MNHQTNIPSNETNKTKRQGFWRKLWKLISRYFESVERPPNLDGFLGYLDRDGTYHHWSSNQVVQRLDRYNHY